MDYFKIPEVGENECAYLSNLTSDVPQIYLLNDSRRRRETYSLVNFKWVKTYSQTSSSAFNVSTLCELNDLDYYVPPYFLNTFIIGSVIMASVLAFGLFKVFKR